MGQQTNKVIKRRRRADYLKRKREQAKLGAIVKKPAAKKPDAPAKKEAATTKKAPARKAAAKKTAKKAPAKKAAKKTVAETIEPSATVEESPAPVAETETRPEA